MNQYDAIAFAETVTGEDDNAKCIRALLAYIKFLQNEVDRTYKIEA